MGIIKAICTSEVRGVQKVNAGSGFLKTGWGIEGDAHGGDWDRQVSLLSYDKVCEFNAQGADVSHGDFGENILVEGIDFALLPIGTRVRLGHGVVEVTMIGKECKEHCQIYDKVGDCIMPREGVFAKVIESGAVSVGDNAEILNYKTFSAAVVTLSDKGFASERLDLSGEMIAKLLYDYGYEVKEQHLLPDDYDKIVEALTELCDNRSIDLIITTGGTGFSKRDITPEATLAVSQRIAPGISEALRAFSLNITPNAMFSRGVSVIRGNTLIINLPGSPKAVKECLEYLLPYLNHGLDILKKIYDL